MGLEKNAVQIVNQKVSFNQNQPVRCFVGVYVLKSRTEQNRKIDQSLPSSGASKEYSNDKRLQPLHTHLGVLLELVRDHLLDCLFVGPGPREILEVPLEQSVQDAVGNVSSRARQQRVLGRCAGVERVMDETL